jgi:hypothetical protein
MSKYKESPEAKSKIVRLYDPHIQFLATLKNASHYVRWLLDQDEGFKEFQRSKKDGK